MSFEFYIWKKEKRQQAEIKIQWICKPSGSFMQPRFFIFTNMLGKGIVQMFRKGVIGTNNDTEDSIFYK